MVEVQICGKSYPLCLTVAALDDINSRCGGLENVFSFLDGSEPQYIIPPDNVDTPEPQFNMARIASNTIWLLAVLLREGENNRLMRARLEGESPERGIVPALDDLAQLLTVASALKYRAAVMEAVAESMIKEIEAVYPKNGKDAEQE